MFLSRAKNIYAKALRQTQNVGTAQTVEQTATAATEGADAEEISLDDLDAQLAAGEITEDEYDEIRDEREFLQEEQYTAGERKYSVREIEQAQRMVDTGRALGYDNTVNEAKGGEVGNERREETRGAFHRRAIRKGCTVKERGQTVHAFRRHISGDLSESAGIVEKNLREKRIQVIVHDGLDNVKEAYRGTKNASDPTRREEYFLLVSEFTDEAGDTVNVSVYINRHSQVNRVFLETNKISTVYGKTALRDYIMIQVKSGNLVRIKRKSTESSERTAHMAAGYRNDTSNEIIADGRQDLKQYSLAGDVVVDNW